MTALAFAALLVAPLALLVRQRRTPHGALPWGPRDENAANQASRAYSLALIAVAAWLAIGVIVKLMSLQHNLETATLLAIVLGCLFKAPTYPMAGPIAYLLLSYTFGREDTVTVTLQGLGAASAVAALSVGAALLWSWRRRERPTIPDGWLGWSVAIFAAWMAVAVVAAVAGGRALGPEVALRAARYAQAVALFLVVAGCRPNLQEIRVTTLALASALVVRQVVLTSYWFNEQNLAMLTAVTVPMVLAVAACRPFSRWQVPLAVLGAYMAGMIIFVQNRGAVVGLGAALVGMWLLARARWLWMMVLAAGSTVAIKWALEAGLLNRFGQVYADGRFLGTAALRLEIWMGGLGIARDHWLFGIGPGNFTAALATYSHGGLQFNADNSFVELLVESGGPSLVLYVVVFMAALWHLARAARRHRLNWRRPVASGLLGAFAAHLAAGTFLSNPSLVWTWILIGVAASLSTPADAPEMNLPRSDYHQS